MNSQLACTYAALALFDDGVDITSEKIQTILKAANVTVETYWPGLFEGLIKEKGVATLLTGACKGGGGPAVATESTDDKGGDKKKVEEKEEEEEEEESSASGPGLFGDDSSSDDDSSSG
eukprot:82525_1